MKNDAPERIWAWPKGSWFTAGASDKKVVSAGAMDVEYTRADHAQAELQAAVAAERDACAKYHDNFLMTQTSCDVEKVVASTEAIRARTDTDAQAALEAVKREARNDGLMEAVVKVESHIEIISPHSPTSFALDWVRDDILALMKDTDDE